MEVVETDRVHTKTQSAIVAWTLPTRLAFRFCFVYFGAYSLSTQIITSFLPVPNFNIPDASAFWPIRPIVFWTAAHIFRVSQSLVYKDTGSGDKRFDWVLMFCILTFAIVVSAIWSALDRKRPNYSALYKWFRLFIRFCLASQMIVYGMMKAFPVQMPAPYLTQLVERFGDFSPMGVLWSSIGVAPAYEVFAGCAELLGGVLLVFPRTTTLGALVCLADLTHVFVLNMTYDVPVKLLSFHLILLSLLLLVPDVKRLVDFFLLNRPTAPSADAPLFTARRASRIAFAAQLIVGLWLLGMNAYASKVAWYQYGGGRPVSPLYGIWEVKQQVVDGQVRAPQPSDSNPWRRITFDFPTFVNFQRMDDSPAWYAISIDMKNKTLVMTDDQDKNWKANFSFERSGQDDMTLDGSMGGRQVRMQLKRIDQQFRLVSRGFHWIQDYPYNR
jgi:uncharacterized membrane protein YphA (DoxX/SURF4 family)